MNNTQRQKANRIAHFLSFDVEEYFHVEAAALTPSEWRRWPSRIESSIDTILDRLKQHNTLATFFVLGDVAEHHPQMIRRIVAAGHEIAAHTFSHTMITRLSPQVFRSDLDRNRKQLQDLTAQPILGFRAPTFSITRETLWAVDVLADVGFTYDSSIFPIHHDRYGISDAPTTPYRLIGPSGATLIEIPPLVAKIGPWNIPLGGGGYFRLWPRWLTSRALRAGEKRHQHAMLYLHPWEFDPDQPKLPMRSLSQIRHRIGLRSTTRKLDAILSRHRFMRVADAMDHLTQLSLTWPTATATTH